MKKRLLLTTLFVAIAYSVMAQGYEHKGKNYDYCLNYPAYYKAENDMFSYNTATKELINSRLLVFFNPWDGEICVVEGDNEYTIEFTKELVKDLSINNSDIVAFNWGKVPSVKLFAKSGKIEIRNYTHTIFVSTEDMKAEVAGLVRIAKKPDFNPRSR